MNQFNVLNFQEKDNKYSFLLKGVNEYLITIEENPEIEENQYFPIISNSINVFSYQNQNIIFLNEMYLQYALSHLKIQKQSIKVQIFEDLNDYELLCVLLFCFNYIQKSEFIIKGSNEIFLIYNNENFILQGLI